MEFGAHDKSKQRGFFDLAQGAMAKLEPGAAKDGYPAAPDWPSSKGISASELGQHERLWSTQGDALIWRKQTAPARGSQGQSRW